MLLHNSAADEELFFDAASLIARARGSRVAGFSFLESVTGAGVNFCESFQRLLSDGGCVYVGVFIVSV